MKFYVDNGVKYLTPGWAWRLSFRHNRDAFASDDAEYIAWRVNHYAKLPPGSKINPEESLMIKDYKFPFGKKQHHSTYFFDLLEIVRCFPKKLRFSYIFGDIAHEAPYPAFVKTRPITSGCTNSVILNLNRVRHFVFINDRMPFTEKKDMIVMRNIVQYQPWRTEFIRMYHDNPMCDVGQINNDPEVDPAFVKPYMSMADQLCYKFICCIEGNDVATNLKWVMSSNSLAVMPKPRIESWFMESTLIGGVHYVEIKPDYSDLEEKMRYYIEHPDEAQAIIDNAHNYVKMFFNRKREKNIGRLVAERYFQLTSQL